MQAVENLVPVDTAEVIFLLRIYKQYGWDAIILELEEIFIVVRNWADANVARAKFGDFERHKEVWVNLCDFTVDDKNLICIFVGIRIRDIDGVIAIWINDIDLS